eukprot:1336564-Amorphochlora_amoeboformis.AAC.1
MAICAAFIGFVMQTIKPRFRSGRTFESQWLHMGSGLGVGHVGFREFHWFEFCVELDFAALTLSTW